MVNKIKSWLLVRFKLVKFSSSKTCLTIRAVLLIENMNFFFFFAIWNKVSISFFLYPFRFYAVELLYIFSILNLLGNRFALKKNLTVTLCVIISLHSVNPWRRSGKKPTGDITICRLYKGLRFHTEREDGTNPTSIRPTKRNRSSNNDSLQKHQSESTFTRWRHRILRHCCGSTTRRHANPIPLYHLPRLRD